MKYSLEAVFHRKLKALNVTKGQQGYIMGAFREACGELNIDYSFDPKAEPADVDFVADYHNACRQAVDKAGECVHGTPLEFTCDYCETAKRLEV